MNTLHSDVVTKIRVYVQEVPVAAQDLQQLEEALTLAAAPGPAAPIRASPSDDSPAVQQQGVNVAEATAFPADEQPVGIHSQHGVASPAGSAEATASGQSEGSVALQQAPAAEATAQVDTQEVPANEAMSSAAACKQA